MNAAKARVRTRRLMVGWEGSVAGRSSLGQWAGTQAQTVGLSLMVAKRCTRATRALGCLTPEASSNRAATSETAADSSSQCSRHMPCLLKRVQDEHGRELRLAQGVISRAHNVP